MRITRYHSRVVRVLTYATRLAPHISYGLWCGFVTPYSPHRLYPNSNQYVESMSLYDDDAVAKPNHPEFFEISSTPQIYCASRFVAADLATWRLFCDMLCCVGFDRGALTHVSQIVADLVYHIDCKIYLFWTNKFITYIYILTDIKKKIKMIATNNFFYWERVIDTFFVLLDGLRINDAPRANIMSLCSYIWALHTHCGARSN